MRAVLLAVIVAIALVGGIASTADAKTTPSEAAQAAIRGPEPAATDAGPGDPGLPPGE